MEFRDLDQSDQVGRYQVVRRIGQGSMGTVFEALLTDYPDQRVALKILAAEHLGNKRVLRRFQNELEACYRISHPNVVRPIEVVRGGGIFGYSMELVEGGNLQQYRKQEELDERAVVSILRQLSQALSAVHEAGVIHRDLKPENVLIGRSVKLTDFGTALLIGGPRLTTEGSVLGSIPYLSPEYVERQQLDVRSDLYALGIIAYELLSGEVPGSGNGITELINLKLHGRLPEVPSRSNTLKRAVERLTARAPENRFQSAQAVAEEFRIIEQELGVEQAGSWLN